MLSDLKRKSLETVILALRLREASRPKGVNEHWVQRARLCPLRQRKHRDPLGSPLGGVIPPQQTRPCTRSFTHTRLPPFSATIPNSCPSPIFFFYIWRVVGEWGEEGRFFDCDHNCLGDGFLNLLIHY